MTPQEIQDYVSDIRSDLASVKWAETDDAPIETKPNIPKPRTFKGTGNKWAHILIVWVEQSRTRCDGTATSLSKPLIVRYTPELAQRVLKLLEEGGFSG